MSNKQFLKSEENDGRYMTKLFIEVIKMMGIQGYNTLNYQHILDAEKERNFRLSRGEILTYENDPLPDDIFCKKMLLEKYKVYKDNYGVEYADNNLQKNSREHFNSFFHKDNSLCIVYFLEEKKETNSVAKEDVTFYLSFLKDTSLKIFGNADFNVINFTSILISEKLFSPQSRTWIENIPKIKHFLDSQLLCPISDTILNSRRNILTEEENIKFQKELNISLSKIPAINNKKDISYRYWNIEKDSIVLEKRDTIFPESMLKQNIFYRLSR
jgi:hypothetical protein